jgi:hypothetical protein
MSKNVVDKGHSKGSGDRRKSVEYVIPKAQSDQWAIREQSAGSTQVAEPARRPTPKRKKVSEYTREEAEWLNSLVHSAAKGSHV